MADDGKISVQLRIDLDLHAWLAQEAKEHRSSLAHVVRTLINDAMKASMIENRERNNINENVSSNSNP
jgi:uncharacterized membrane protein YebE (DUF533 family)